MWRFVSGMRLATACQWGPRSSIAESSACWEVLSSCLLPSLDYGKPPESKATAELLAVLERLSETCRTSLQGAATAQILWVISRPSWWSTDLTPAAPGCRHDSTRWSKGSSIAFSDHPSWDACPTFELQCYCSLAAVESRCWGISSVLQVHWAFSSCCCASCALTLSTVAMSSCSSTSCAALERWSD